MRPIDLQPYDNYSGVFFYIWLACPGFLALLGVLNHVLLVLLLSAYYYAYFAYDDAYYAYC